MSNKNLAPVLSKVNRLERELERLTQRRIRVSQELAAARAELKASIEAM